MVHQYQEEDPFPRRSVVARKAALVEEEVLCSEVGSQQRQQKVLADLISRQKVLVWQKRSRYSRRPNGDAHRAVE